MNELIEELENDIINCRIDAGDGGSNADWIDDALETLEKIKALAKAQLTIPVVSNNRELLIVFYGKMLNNMYKGYTNETIERHVDNFLKNN